VILPSLVFPDPTIGLYYKYTLTIVGDAYTIHVLSGLAFASALALARVVNHARK